MRPARLELEGFTSFRERTVVDFEGVELFALAGPTGAGKSGVIDAMIFALYGMRLSDERQVAPVISQGRTEARVRLDFDVGGERWTNGAGGAAPRRPRHDRRAWSTPGRSGGNARELDVEVRRCSLHRSAVHDVRGPAAGPVRPVPPGQAGRSAGPAGPPVGARTVRRRPEAAGQVAGRLEGERTELTA